MAWYVTWSKEGDYKRRSNNKVNLKNEDIKRKQNKTPNEKRMKCRIYYKTGINITKSNIWGVNDFGNKVIKMHKINAQNDNERNGKES